MNMVLKNSSWTSLVLMLIYSILSNYGMSETLSYDYVNLFGSDIKAQNCGQNVCLAALVWLSKENRGEKSSNLFSAKTSFEAMTMGEIAQWLKEKDIASIGLSAKSPSEFISIFKSKQGVIIHSPMRGGHYFFSYKEDTNKYIVVESPNRTWKFSKEEFKMFLSKVSSGKYLICATRIEELPRIFANTQPEIADKAALPKVPVEANKTSMVFEKNTILNQVIMPKTVFLNNKVDEKLTASVEITNQSGRELLITKVDGSCSCFDGWSGLLKVAPYSKEKIGLSFHKMNFDFTNGTEVAVFAVQNLKEDVRLIKIEAPKDSLNYGFASPSRFNFGTLSKQDFSKLEINMNIYSSRSTINDIKIIFEKSDFPFRIYEMKEKDVILFKEKVKLLNLKLRPKDLAKQSVISESLTLNIINNQTGNLLKVSFEGILN